MFEKEAEEYRDNKGKKRFEEMNTIAEFATMCFKDGAEFGYNKAKKETKNLLNDCLKQLDKSNYRESLIIKKIEQFLSSSENPNKWGRRMTFEKQIERLSDIAVRKNYIAQNAVVEVTKLIQTKYPELEAEYSISDGGIIFINDSTIEEYYNFEQIYSKFGRR